MTVLESFKYTCKQFMSIPHDFGESKLINEKPKAGTIWSRRYAYTYARTHARMQIHIHGRYGQAHTYTLRHLYTCTCAGTDNAGIYMYKHTNIHTHAYTHAHRPIYNHRDIPVHRHRHARINLYTLGRVRTNTYIHLRETATPTQRH